MQGGAPGLFSLANPEQSPAGTATRDAVCARVCFNCKRVNCSASRRLQDRAHPCCRCVPAPHHHHQPARCCPRIPVCACVRASHTISTNACAGWVAPCVYLYVCLLFSKPSLAPLIVSLKCMPRPIGRHVSRRLGQLNLAHHARLPVAAWRPLICGTWLYSGAPTRSPHSACNNSKRHPGLHAPRPDQPGGRFNSRTSDPLRPPGSAR